MRWIRKIGAMTIILPLVWEWTPDADNGTNGLAVGMNGESIIYDICSEAVSEDSVKRVPFSGLEYYGELPFEPKCHFFFDMSEHALILDNDIIVCIDGSYSGWRYYKTAVYPSVHPIDKSGAIEILREMHMGRTHGRSALERMMEFGMDPGLFPGAYNALYEFRSEILRITDMMEKGSEPKLNFYVNINSIYMAFYNVRPDDLQACLKSVGTFKLMNYDKLKDNEKFERRE